MIAYLRWVAQTIGYAIRPYDSLRDARRWRWQARARCGLPRTMTDAQRQALVDAVREGQAARIAARKDPTP